ncbi:MAG: carbohydrate binding family 9 domain-containing protein [Acidobacteria bacterium]|nr:carbohydrate binding family 9 domain-containing protein [Acidobacteriota bacterium]
MRSREPITFLILFCLCTAGILAGPQGSSKEAHNPSRSFVAQRVAEPPKLDGILDELVWSRAELVSDFRQRDPQQGEPATEGTGVGIVYTDSSIFFGIICHDSEPDKIIATDLRRDNALVNDDSVSIILDTFHDHRNAFLFRINPRGTQYDALITDEGKRVDPAWDERWWASAQISPTGWAAEVEIPFKSLRLPDGETQVWGLDIQRVIRRKNEAASWSNYSRNFEFEQVSQAGHLVGLENVRKGLRLRIKPFAIVGAKTSGIDPGAHNLSEVGLEDVKYRITPSLTADFTVNTDFAQAEVDQQIINLTRFPVFFPEKREFFLEGAGIFEFAANLRETLGLAEEFKLFHSRTIGLSPSGQTIPILGGGRLTGKVGGYNVGVLMVQTDSFQRIPANNFGVLRVKKDIFSRSSVGAIFTNRSAKGEDFNRLVGFDSNLVFLKNLHIRNFFAKSETPGRQGEDWGAFGQILWESDFLAVGTAHITLRPNFNPELGFLQREDVRKTTAEIAIKPRPRSGPIRQLTFRTFFEYFTDNRNVLQTKLTHYSFRIAFQNGSALLMSPHREFERLEKPFRLSRRVVVPAGDYRWTYYRMQYMFDPARRLSGNIVYEPGGFYGGITHSFAFIPRFKVTEKFSVDGNYGADYVSVPQGTFTSHVTNARINYAFTSRWLTATTLQYNSNLSLIGVNFRLNYIFREGDDFFLVYNEAKDLSGLNGGLVNRSLVAKLTYSFDF